MAHKHDDEKVVYVGDSRVRQKSSRPDPQDYTAYPGKSEAFIPNFLLKEWMVGAVVLVGFMVLVISHPAPLGYPAEPTNTNFIPMPDWYFLFMYQLLKYPYTSESFKVLGTIVMPGLAFGSLLLAPFLDTGKERRFYRRPIATSLMIVALISVFYLTYVSWDHYTKELEARGITPEHELKRAEVMAGIETSRPSGGGKPATISLVEAGSEGHEIYKRATCVTCHGDALKGQGDAMPALLGIGDTYTKEEIVDIINNGKGRMGEQYTQNISQGLTDADLDKLADWLAIQKKPE